MIPFVSLKLDKIYQLRFDMSASIRYQQLTGKSIYEINESQLDDVIDVLWAILIKDDNSLTRQAVIDLIDNNADNNADVVTAMSAVVKLAYEVRGGSKNVKSTAIKR